MAGVFLLSLIAAVLVRYSGLFVSVINWDESLYAVMAQHWLMGELPYQAVWDQHSVGLPALFAAILYFFPQSIVAIRLSGCVAIAVAATAIYFGARLFDRRPLPGIVAATLYLMWTARWWGLAANTEVYLNALIATAMVILLRESAMGARGREAIGPLALGALLLGLALQVKHVALAETAVFFAVLCAGIAWESRRVAITALAVAVGVFLLPSILVVGYFWAEGLASQYFDATINSNLTYVTGRTSFAAIWPVLPKTFLLPIAMAGCAALLLVRRPERRPIIVALWAAAAMIDVALPGKFWDHYFLLLMPAAALLGGYLAGRFGDRWPRYAVVALLAAIVIGHPVGVVKDALRARDYTEHDGPRAIADYIDDRLSPGATIFVFNYQPVLYLLTGASLPSRYVQPDAWSREFTDVSHVVPARELERVFATRPEFVTLIAEDWNDMGEEAFARLHEYLAASYVEDFVATDVQTLLPPTPVHVYRRKDVAAGDANPPG